MKKTITAILLGILLVGTLGIAVVSAVASDDAKVNNDLGQMHTLCGKYMDSGTMHNERMHDLCGKYMGSGEVHNWCNRYMNSNMFKLNNSNESAGKEYTDSDDNKRSFSCH